MHWHALPLAWIGSSARTPPPPRREEVGGAVVVSFPEVDLAACDEPGLGEDAGEEGEWEIPPEEENSERYASAGDWEGDEDATVERRGE